MKTVVVCSAAAVMWLSPVGPSHLVAAQRAHHFVSAVQTGFGHIGGHAKSGGGFRIRELVEVSQVDDRPIMGWQFTYDLSYRTHTNPARRYVIQVGSGCRDGSADLSETKPPPVRTDWPVVSEDRRFSRYYMPTRLSHGRV